MYLLVHEKYASTWTSAQLPVLGPNPDANINGYFNKFCKITYIHKVVANISVERPRASEKENNNSGGGKKPRSVV